MQPSHRPPFPPALVLSIGILAVSTASIFIRFAQQQAPSLVIAAARLAIATLVLAPFVLLRRRHELRSLSKAQVGLALLSGALLALHFATWITSLEYTTVASSVVLVSTVPLWVALLSPLTIKEPITRPVVVGMLLALLGGAIVGVSDSCAWQSGQFICPDWAAFVRGQAFWGDLLALVGAVTAAGYLLIGRRLRSSISLLSYVFLVYGMASIVLVALALGSGATFSGYAPQIYLWLALLALIPQLIGHSSYNWALGYLPAAYVSIAILGEPIGSTILAFIILDETPDIVKIGGAALILAGIYTASRSQKNG